jgi:hypothetical protein
MEFAIRLTRTILRIIASAVAALARGAELVLFTRPPDVFAWRDALRERPALREQPLAPLRIQDACFHSLLSFGSPAGAVLSLRVENVSFKPISALVVGYETPDTGSRLHELKAALEPGQTGTFRIDAGSEGAMTLWVESALFTDGSEWHDRSRRGRPGAAAVTQR